MYVVQLGLHAGFDWFHTFASVIYPLAKKRRSNASILNGSPTRPGRPEIGIDHSSPNVLCDS